MKVFLAGRIAVEAEGVVLDERHLPGRQGRLLFAYLVAANGRPVPQDELADVLWGDAPPATWDKALSVLVSKLRGVLAESGSRRGADCRLWLLPARPSRRNVGRRPRSRERGEGGGGIARGRRAGEATAAAELAESVTRSPFLPGDDGPWVEAKRRELAEVRARALSVLAEASLRTGKAAEAVRWAELAVEAEPFRESGYRRLMAAQVAAGNRAEALQVYERCRQLLAEELGAYPSPETESIYRSLLEAPPAEQQRRSRVRRHRRELRRLGRPPQASGSRGCSARRLGGGRGGRYRDRVVATRSNGQQHPPPCGGAGRARRAPLAARERRSLRPVPGRARSARGASTACEHRRSRSISRSRVSRACARSVGNFGLVLLAGQFVDARFVDEIARHPHTRFVVMDPDPRTTPLYSAVSTLPERDRTCSSSKGRAPTSPDISAHSWRNGKARGKRPVVVSLIAGDPG